jgi:hypothetical protein
MQTLSRPVAQQLERPKTYEQTIQELSQLPTRKVPLEHLAAVMELRSRNTEQRFAKRGYFVTSGNITK